MESRDRRWQASNSRSKSDQKAAAFCGRRALHCNRFEAFAQRIIGRYARWQPERYTVMTVIRQNLASVTIVQTPSGESGHPAPDYAGFRPLASPPRLSNASMPDQPIYNFRLKSVARVFHRDVRQGILLTNVDQIVQRMIVSRMRSEAEPDHRVPFRASARSAAHHEALTVKTDLTRLPPASVARIVRRQRPVRIDTAQPNTLGDALKAPRHASHGNGRARSQDEASKLDVNQLTEQVIQLIDRRFVAYRERMGRF